MIENDQDRFFPSSILISQQKKKKKKKKKRACLGLRVRNLAWRFFLPAVPVPTVHLTVKKKKKKKKKKK